MSISYGIPVPGAHSDVAHREPARYLVVIDSDGSTIARLFTEGREQVAEYDAGAEEVALMTRGLAPSRSADASEWDQALSGHSAKDRGAARVFHLAI